jgi:hypothetical protein
LARQVRLSLPSDLDTHRIPVAIAAVASTSLLKIQDAWELDSIIGSVMPGRTRIENGRGIAGVRFSERAEVEPVWKDVEAGHIRCLDRLLGPSLRGNGSTTAPEGEGSGPSRPPAALRGRSSPKIR